MEKFCYLRILLFWDLGLSGCWDMVILVFGDSGILGF